MLTNNMSPEANQTDQAFLKTQIEFAQHIRQPNDESLAVGSLSTIEPRRMKIYSELFYNNIEGFVSANFPVLHDIIDEVTWHKLVRQFMVDYRCQSPIFAEIGREFIQFLESDTFQQSPLAGLLADFTLELAYYEWMELVVSIDTQVITWPHYDKSSGGNDGEDLLLCSLGVSELSKLGTFSYPVHHISNVFIPTEEDKHETSLLIYRDRGNDVNFISLAPLSAILYQQLSETDAASTTIYDVLHPLHEQLQFNNWPEFKKAGLTIIMDWLEKDILYQR